MSDISASGTTKGAGDQDGDQVARLAKGFLERIAQGQPLMAIELALVEQLQQQGQKLDRIEFDRTEVGIVLREAGPVSIGAWLVKALRGGMLRSGNAAQSAIPAASLPALARQLAQQGEVAAAAGAALMALRLKWSGTKKHNATAADEIAEQLQELLAQTQEQQLALGLACWRYELKRRSLDEDDRQLLSAGIELADRLQTAGHRKAALNVLQTVQIICQRELGTEHLLSRKAAQQRANLMARAGDASSAARVITAEGLAAKRSNMASISARGAVDDEAVNAILIRIESLNDEHPETTWQAERIAERLYSQGKYRLARRLQVAIYERYFRLRGQEHPRTLYAANELACTLWKLGDLPGARKLQESVYKVRRRTLGAEHPRTLKSAGNLATTLLSQGDFVGACGINERVFDAHKRVLGVEHVDTLTAANNLASSLSAMGDVASARKIEEWVFKTCQRVLGDKHPDTLISASNLASSLIDLGDIAAARSLQELVFETRSRVLGAEHPGTLLSANNLALTLQSQGDLAAARRIQESTYETHQRTLGAEHMHTLVARGNLGMILVAQRELLLALTINESVFETCRRVLGEVHPYTLTAANNLAVTLHTRGEFDRARSINQFVVETRKRVLGASHPATLDSVSNLAGTLQALGDLAAARRLQESVLEARLHAFGPEHPATLRSAGVLSNTLRSLGEVELAGNKCLLVLVHLCRVGVANDVSFQLTATLPVVSDPSAAWAEAVLSGVSEHLPRLSQLLTHRLELLPQDSWATQHALYEIFHRHWVGFAALHAPQQLLMALSGLHGIRSRSQVQLQTSELQALAQDSSNPASPLASHLLQARESVNALRERLHHLYNRTGPNAPGFAELQAQERTATVECERAEAALAGAAPDVAAGLGVLDPLSQERVLASLQPDEAWLSIAPTQPPLALLQRPEQPIQTMPMGDLAELGRVCERYVSAVRDGRQGSLRDSLEPELNTAALEPLRAIELLAQAKLLCAQAFWAPLTPHLQGLRRLHLVTAANQHQLLLEFAQPAELASLEVLRYNGLAAYQRSLLPDVASASAATQPLPLMVITDTAEQTGEPIPFTQLDAVVPLRRGIAQRISAPELMQRLHDTAQPVAVLISAHGGVARPADGRLGGGHVRLPDGVELDPRMLATLRGRIGWLMWVSCWAARVVHGGQGEPYGSISTLQQKGLRGGIGCLAPVSDYYSPLLSAAVWHERLQGVGAAAALTKAKSRLTEGDWAGMEEDIEALRQEYRVLMLKLVQPLREQAEQPEWDPWQWHDERLQRVVRAWPLDGPVVHALQEHSVAVVLGTDLAQHESTIDDCLQSLFMPARARLQENDERSQRVQQEIERLCAVVVAFGRG